MWSRGEVTRCNSGGMVTVCHCPFHQMPCNDMSKHLEGRCAEMLLMTKCPLAARNHCFGHLLCNLNQSTFNRKEKKVSNPGSGISVRKKIQGSCLSGVFLMKLDVFSCCGLMRLNRVLGPCKQNPSEEKMPGYPRPPYQEIRLDKKQTQVQALASRLHSILHHSTKHQVDYGNVSFFLYRTTN